MFEILPLTPDLLAELGAELGGCDFTHASQTDFLAEGKACDVQAAPGNGKTTLLAAKLALLSRNWVTRRQGICVISHTNAARTEVEDLIASHPTAARLMAYPHFTGTVTAFINQYLAMPYLRGLGWPVRQIDDDAFAAAALRRMPHYGALKAQADRAPTAVKRWVTGLDLDPEFVDAGPRPSSLKVRHRKGQHGPDTDCGKALATLKARLVLSGLYRYADMTALAWRALSETSSLSVRLRQRFPLVLLDEAQDTNGEQLKLLEHLFGGDTVAFQRLGDSNQTLYEDGGITPAYWTPAAGCIPLDQSRRFGGDIASFASRLTARRAQTIQGLAPRPNRRVLFLFDESTIGGVFKAFSEEAKNHWPDDHAVREVWAVASRHSQAARRGEWQPMSLVDYHPAYRSEGGAADHANLLCRQFQKAALHNAAGHAPSEVAEMLAAGVAGLARLYGWTAENARPITSHNVWRVVARSDVNMSRRIRRLLRDKVLCGDAPWEEAAWLAFLSELLPEFGSASASENIVAYCAFVSEHGADLSDPLRRSTKHVAFGDLTVRLGSIHSVKGKSVDGILVVESQVWKGPATGEQCFDLPAVLPHAFGVTNDVFTGVQLIAATNVFVGVTRPRELLGLAIRKSMAPAIIGPAKLQGWRVVDLTEQSEDLSSSQPKL